MTLPDALWLSFLLGCVAVDISICVAGCVRGRDNAPPESFDRIIESAAMSYCIGDKVKLLPVSLERASYQGLSATITEVIIAFGDALYKVVVDEDGHVFEYVTDAELESYFIMTWKAPRTCVCDLRKGPCMCMAGQAELAAERRRIQG